MQMLEIKYNVFDKHEREIIDEKICSVWISSTDEEESCNIVYNILTNVFQKNQVVFRASGLPHNLEDIMGVIKNCSPNYFEGDSKKFYIRKYPELHAEISDIATLKNILSAFSWTNFHPEERFLYVLKEGQIDDVFNVLKENVYNNGGSHISLLWKHLNCMVENVPEVEDHNTYNLIFREEYLNEIKSLLASC